MTIVTSLLLSFNFTSRTFIYGALEVLLLFLPHTEHILFCWNSLSIPTFDLEYINSRFDKMETSDAFLLAVIFLPCFAGFGAGAVVGPLRHQLIGLCFLCPPLRPRLPLCLRQRLHR